MLDVTMKTKLFTLADQLSGVGVSIETLKGDKQSHTQEITIMSWDILATEYPNEVKQFGIDLKELASADQWKAIKGIVSKVKKVFEFAQANELVVNTETEQVTVNSDYHPNNSDVAFSTVYREVSQYIKDKAEQASLALDRQEKMFELYREKHPETAKLSDTELALHTKGQVYSEGAVLLEEYEAQQSFFDKEQARIDFIEEIKHAIKNDADLEHMIKQLFN